MSTTQDIVQKLWALCNVLRDDGITYQDYITELTWLLFLKMAQETGAERQLPKGYRWENLKSKDHVQQLAFYREMLLHLGTQKKLVVQQIFDNASTSIRYSRSLARLVSAIDSLDWYSAREEGLGDMYEGLLEKNASEQKSGAGQYFTPRALIDCMVELIKPRAGEIIQDPAAGTGGFLIASDRYIKKQTSNLGDLSERERKFQRQQAFFGVELVPGARRLCLMNALLHGIEGKIFLGDSLAPEDVCLPSADVILTNPPFGSKRNIKAPARTDIAYPTSNKQLSFLQHTYEGLKPGGRAAIVVPDNVLFEEGVGALIRADLMEKCNLHTILRLPVGIFYAAGVSTNVLFFQRGEKVDRGNTRSTWIYDLRTNLSLFGRRTLFTRENLSNFEKAFGPDPYGRSRRIDGSDTGRFRVFTREQVAARRNSLDISWLKQQPPRRDIDLSEPEAIVVAILANLREALGEVEEMSEALLGGVDLS